MEYLGFIQGVKLKDHYLEKKNDIVGTLLGTFAIVFSQQSQNKEISSGL